MDNNIKIIDVFGSSDSKGAEHHYSYFAPNYSMYSGWSKYVSDLREELAPGIQECYCCFCTKEGWWISKIIRNPHDLREDPIMVSVCIGEYRPKYGKRTVELLDGFVDFFIIQKTWNDEETEKKLLCVDQDLDLVPCVLIESALPTVNHKSAYRTYGTVEELYDCISFLPQQGYKDYSRVFFVPREQSTGMPIECIDVTIPLRRIYTLHYPEDCSSPSEKTEIMEGEELKLVYTKQGLEPFEKYIKGGETTDFAYVEGDSMYIRSGKDLGLVHNRVIEIICKDKSNKRIYDFSLRNYTQQNNAIVIKGKTVVVPENEKGDIIVWVDPSDEKYDSQKVNLTGVVEDHKDVCLETKYYNVVFKMKGKIFKTTEDTLMSPSEAKNDWDEYDCEIDNLNRIVCFTVHRFSPERKHHERTHFVREEMPLGKRIGNFFKEWWTLILVVLVGIAAVYFMYAAIATYLVKYPQWPFGTKPEKEQETLGHNHGAFGDDKKEDEKTIDSTEFFVQHDIDYLKQAKEQWEKTAIKSSEYKTLYENIENGNVEEVIANCDTLLKESNIAYKNVVEGLIKIRELENKSAGQEASIKMKQLSRDGMIKVAELSNELNMVFKNYNSKEKPSNTNRNTKTSTGNGSNPTEKQRPHS